MKTGEEKDKGNIFKEIMVENFQNLMKNIVLMKNIKPHIQEAQKTLSMKLEINPHPDTSDPKC